ncbi:hypothetical protein D3C72_2021470 [compost metagenome]
MHQLPSRKDVALNKLANARAQLFVVCTTRRDAMNQRQATRTQQAFDSLKVAQQVGVPHMLKHTDRGQLVIRCIDHLPVVTQLNLHLATQPQRLNLLEHVLVLVA